MDSDVPVIADSQEFIYIICVRTLDVVWRTCRLIERDGEVMRGNERQ